MAFTKSICSLIITGIIMLIVQGCDMHRDDEIPYDKEKAKEHIRPLKYAAGLTSGFKRGKVELSRQLKDPAYLDKKFSLPDAEYFNRDAIAALLNQKGVKGMRIYLGKDGDTIKMVLVGVDAKGNDIAGKLTAANTRMNIMSSEANSSDAIILEAGQRCPTMCAAASPLYQ